VSNAETGEVLAVVRQRDFRALSSFLASQGQRWCRRVEVVVTDGSPSYRAAIERHLGHATHVWITSTSSGGARPVSSR